MRHEQAAGYAADGLYRATGAPGAALLTTGVIALLPFTTNKATALNLFGNAKIANNPATIAKLATTGTRDAFTELTSLDAKATGSVYKLAAGDMTSFAELVTSVSIDRGLLERSRNLVVLPTECAWDDVGTWASLRRVRDLDDTGNGVMGHVHCVDASGNVIHADGCCVVAYGISGMLVVSLDGLTFVTTLERASELGPLLNSLPGSLRYNPGRNHTS